MDVFCSFKSICCSWSFHQSIISKKSPKVHGNSFTLSKDRKSQNQTSQKGLHFGPKSQRKLNCKYCNKFYYVSDFATIYWIAFGGAGDFGLFRINTVISNMTNGSLFSSLVPSFFPPWKFEQKKIFFYEMVAKVNVYNVQLNALMVTQPYTDYGLSQDLSNKLSNFSKNNSTTHW